ncbi:MAG: class I SAM-dependent methyltransferase [Planctomycetes bacterium]|nr:class I SAM-dependent methyltransferase [Planctomycetota bacterium]
MASISINQRLFPDESYHLFLNEIERHMPPEGAVLDLGCGDNRMLAPWLAPRRQMWGVDFHKHPALVDPACFRLLEPDGTIPFDDNSFDVIISRWVLEHVTHPERFLADVARVLRPGGVFVSLTVNAKHYVSWLARLFHLAPHSWTQTLIHRLLGRPHEDTFTTYYRLNSLERMDRAARPAGLDVMHSRFYASQEYFAFSKSIYSLAAFVDGTLEMAWPTLGKMYWVVSLRKRRSNPAKTGHAKPRRKDLMTDVQAA